MKQEIMYLVILSSLLASCAGDEQQAGMPGAEGSLHVSSVTVNPGGHTDAGAATRLTGDDVAMPVTQGSLGIFRSRSTGYDGTQDNKKYTYIETGNGWQPATPGDAILLNANVADVCAYYPYHSDAAYSDKTALPLTPGKYAGGNGTHDPADLCYDTDRPVSSTRRTTGFTMRHAMAMLELKLSKETGYVGDCRVTSVSLLNPGLITSSAINITDGTYSAAPVKGTLTYSPGTDADGMLIGSAAATTAALLVPFTPSGAGLTVSFNVNGTPIEANIPATTIAKVEAGHRYTVKITMKASSMQVTGVDMMPWTEINVGGDGHTWEPQIPTPPAPAPVIIGIQLSPDEITLTGNGCTDQDKADLSLLTWAEGNLKSTGDGSSDDYVWTTPTDYGYYYTFMSTYTGNTSQNGIDPCTKLDPDLYGTGWRTPSINELEKLSRCTDKQLVSNNGVMGMWFMNNPNGVFLPAAGSRSFRVGSGTSPIDDTGGFYWSSDVIEGNGAYMQTYYGGVICYNIAKSSGLSVRCVKGTPQ